MLGVTALLLWFSLRSLNLGEDQNKGQFLWNTWLRSNKTYLFVMALVAMVSHVIRAERWRMLMVPTGHRVALSSSFLSVMVGYLINLVIPRGGEFSRCINLQQLEKTPVEISFGTVVIERIVDVMCLLILLAIAFIVEWDQLILFIQSLPWSSNGEKFPLKFIILGLVGLACLVGVYFLLRKNERFKKIVGGFREGLLSIVRLEKKGLFIFYSLTIWGLYFLMSYFIVLAFPETSTLGPGAVLVLFAIGAIAMAAPLPGGAGSYHTLVPLGLVALYRLNQADAIAFVFVFHAWQTLIFIIGGIVSLAISYAILQWRKQNQK
jgi:uncharacterized membrane protein YbhN (UPF0104 family)